MPAPRSLEDWSVDEVIEAMDGVGPDITEALMMAVPDAYKAGGVSMHVAWPRLAPEVRKKLKRIADAYASWWNLDPNSNVSMRDWIKTHVPEAHF